MRPSSHLLTLAGLLATAAVGNAAGKFTVTVTNEAGTARPAETIEVPWKEVISRLPGALPDHVSVRDAAGKLLPSQFTNFKPEVREGNVDDFLFQHDFAAGEKSATFTIEFGSAPLPPFPSKTFARYVPERFDDFAWENDKIAHRTYGPALDSPAAGGSRLATSGIDVWVKKVSYPIVDRWYLRGHDNYHKDTGEGIDIFGVGPSVGCGGTGVWVDGKLHAAKNWKTWKILANGPLRTVFELGYGEWDAGGVKVSETRRYTVEAGRYLDQVDSTFTFTGPAEITAAVGLVRQEKPSTPVMAAKADEKAGTLSQWEAYAAKGETHGSIGCGIVLQPGAFAGKAEDDRNHLVLVKAKSGVPVTFLAGAAWDEAGEIKSAAEWDAYLAAWSARLKSPVKITYGASN